MVKDIGIIPWGHRYKIKQAIEDLQGIVAPNESVEDSVVTNDVHEEINVDLEVTNVDHELTNADHLVTDVIQNQSCNIVVNSSLNHVENKSGNECALCEASTQHRCSVCNNKICNFCSEQDPNSTNEMHRIHAKNDSKCLIDGFECPR